MSKGRVLLCGTCMDARGLTAGELIEGAESGTMDELALETECAGKLLIGASAVLSPQASAVRALMRRPDSAA